MNLNSFIGLMGHSLKRVETSDGVILRDVREGESPDFVMRNSEYVLTLDADSMLLRDYCLRLVYQMEQPGNERVAVIQTPYSSYRGARRESNASRPPPPTFSTCCIRHDLL